LPKSAVDCDFLLPAETFSAAAPYLVDILARFANGVNDKSDAKPGDQEGASSP
jgi:hypothetical protein